MTKSPLDVENVYIYRLQGNNQQSTAKTATANDFDYFSLSPFASLCISL